MHTDDMRKKSNEDFSIIGLLCLILLIIPIGIKKVVAVCEHYSYKYPRAATVFWTIAFLIGIGIAGRGDMDSAIAYYGN